MSPDEYRKMVEYDVITLAQTVERLERATPAILRANGSHLCEASDRLVALICRLRDDEAA